MNFFIFCACCSNNSRVPLFLLWTTLFSLFVEFSCEVLLFLPISFSMPVVTRSRSKLLRLTGPTDGLSHSTLLTTGSTDELSLSNTPLLHSSTQLVDTSHVPTPLLSSNSSHSSSPDGLLSSSSSSSALEFQISNNQSYFEISNCHLFENLAVPHESQSHNFSNLNFPIMEEDCEDASTGLSQTTKDIQLLFAAFTQQMTTHMNDLHDHIAENEARLCQKQEQFHRAVKEEMDELRSLVNVSQHPDVPTSSSSPGPLSMSTVPNVSSVTSAPSSQVSGLPSHTPSNSSTASLNTVDLHAQMMLMLTESFSKLTSVMVDQKSSDVKSDWPKFSGDAKKFRSWYLSILAQLSIHPWSELYDSSTNSVVLLKILC